MTALASSHTGNLGLEMHIQRIAHVPGHIPGPTLFHQSLTFFSLIENCSELLSIPLGLLMDLSSFADVLGSGLQHCFFNEFPEVGYFRVKLLVGLWHFCGVGQGQMSDVRMRL